MSLLRVHAARCLTDTDVSTCVSHLLLGIYEKTPGGIILHVSTCIRCRREVVQSFARALAEITDSAVRCAPTCKPN